MKSKINNKNLTKNFFPHVANLKVILKTTVAICEVTTFNSQKRQKAGQIYVS